MTLRELYESIGGDYEGAMRILQIEKLMDKHIRKFTQNGLVDTLVAAVDAMDATQIFEAAHAVKGVCGNLGLTDLYELAAILSDEFRAGSARQYTDEEVRQMVETLKALYQKTAEAIGRYAAE